MCSAESVDRRIRESVSEIRANPCRIRAQQIASRFAAKPYKPRPIAHTSGRPKLTNARAPAALLWA